MSRKWLLFHLSCPERKQELSAGDVERAPVGAAEGAVGDRVLGGLDEVEELSLRRDHVDAGARVERLARPARPVQAGRDVEVPLAVDPHAVAAAPWKEVVYQPLVRHRAVGPQVVGSDPAGPPGAAG